MTKNERGVEAFQEVAGEHGVDVDDETAGILVAEVLGSVGVRDQSVAIVEITRKQAYEDECRYARAREAGRALFNYVPWLD